MAINTYVYLLKYNNYYNRNFKKLETLDEYNPYILKNGTELAVFNVNFKPADGVQTTQVINGYTGLEPDYLLVADEDQNIISRWFVIESYRESLYKYTLTLRRDVLADNWESIVDSPMFIEKATLPQDNKLIFNKEQISLSQIKRSETLLTDDTKTAWIVGYFDRGFNSDGQAEAINFSADIVPDFTASSLSAWDKYDLLDASWLKDNGHSYKIPIYIVGTYSISGDIIISSNDKIDFETKNYPGSDLSKIQFQISQTKDPYKILESIIDSLKTKNMYTTLEQYHKLYVYNITEFNETNYNEVYRIANKILQTADKPNEYYYLKSIGASNFTNSYSITEDKATGYLITYIKNIMTSLGCYYNANATYNTSLVISCSEALVSAQLTQFGPYNLSIPKDTNRLHLKDAPYDMFILPYGDITLKNGTDFSVKLDKKTCMSMAQGIAKNLGSFLYDIQLLPFCPATSFITEEDENGITININSTDNKRLTKIYSGTTQTTVKGAIVWCTASSGSFIIDRTITIPDKKIWNEMAVFRLNSGNYSSSFEFSPAKNDNVSGFNVDFTYIPYNPYIHVSPIFGGLYGSNFQDCRGLIEQGDHSITYLNDRWVEYQINNKNYLNAFNRQIENMDTMHKYDRIENLANIATNAIGAGSGIGALTGNGVAGFGMGLLSAGAGVADFMLSEARYKENLDYTKDNFGFQLDNVKALPNTIAKVVAYTPNNKIFPVLEIYTCSSEELMALCNKIRYNGMTVGVIGTISQYIGNSWNYEGITDKGYIKGQLIQLNDASADYHLVAEIGAELNKGVYTK